MREDSCGGGVGALLGIVLALVLIVGGSVFYLVMQRQQQAVAAAEEQARAAAAVAGAQAKLAHGYVEQVGEAAAKAEVRREQSGVRGPESDEAIRAAVEAVLREQQEAWNQGDVDAFVEHYWKSDDVTFSSGGKTTRGWEETVRGYKERYPTREAMGRLTFANLEITPLGDRAALVLGEWRLERESRLRKADRVPASHWQDASGTQRLERGTGDTPVAPEDGEPLSGNFSLVFRKLDGRWVIVHDHTSRGE